VLPSWLSYVVGEETADEFIERRASMKWMKELFWDSSLSVFDNLTTWALGVVCFTVFYVLLWLVLLLA
jgi:hypothetical protein